MMHLDSFLPGQIPQEERPDQPEVGLRLGPPPPGEEGVQPERRQEGRRDHGQDGQGKGKGQVRRSVQLRVH